MLIFEFSMKHLLRKCKQLYAIQSAPLKKGFNNLKAESESNLFVLYLQIISVISTFSCEKYTEIRLKTLSYTESKDFYGTH